MTDILDALTDEQVEQLKDGETLRVLESIRDPLEEGEPPTSINVIEVELRTEGLIGGIESIEQLPDQFPDVMGLEEAVEDYGHHR